MKITFEVTKAQVMVSPGRTDMITLMVDTPTTYPEMKYKTTIRIDARRGYGETWCKEVLGINPEVINTTLI